MNKNKVLYRKLHRNELEALESEFVKFLVVQGIEASEWEKLKIVAPEKAEALVIVFSNMVFTDILNRIKCLQKLGKNRLELINTELPEWQMIAIAWNDSQIPDFSSLETWMNRDDVVIHTGKKKIERPVDQELFLYLENNYTPSDGVLYASISGYLST